MFTYRKMAKTPWKIQTAQSIFFALVLLSFHVNYTHSSVCSEDIIVEKKSLSSPNYPYHYPSNASCTWIIKSSLEDHEIVLKIQDLDIEPQALCNFDYIQIGSGSVPGENVIVNRLCGTEKPGPIKSDSHALWLRFVSDAAKTFRGFRATWKAKKARKSQVFPNPAVEKNVCGEKILNGVEGTIKSPKFPRKYPYDQKCHWVIMAPRTNRVVIRFQYFDLEGASNCRFDYLLVKDGEHNNSKTIGRYCGSSKPATITTSSNTANLRFNSDTSIARGGFLIRWNAVSLLTTTPPGGVITKTIATEKPSKPECGGQLTSNEGSIQSPLYPEFYPNNMLCTWVISVEKPARIRLTFGTEFDLENEEQCPYDFLSIRDGANIVDSEIGKYCGKIIPNTILSTTSSVHITFRSDKSGGGKGFSLEWIAERIMTLGPITTPVPTTTSPDCGGHLTESTGIITSPKYPMMYPSNQNCVWLLSMASGSQIRLTFDYLELEDDLNCAYDYLLIRDGASIDSPVIGRYCGSSIRISEKYIYSSGKDLRIEFHSDNVGSKGGFRLSWQSILEATTRPTLLTTPTVLGRHRIMRGCGGFFQLGLHSGTIFSPAYPNKYAPYLTCTWTILVEEQNLVAVSFNEFELEYSVGCSSDYVIVKDGISKNSEVLGKYCGTDVPLYLLSSGSELSIVFRTNEVNSAKGFEISWMKYEAPQSSPTGIKPPPVNKDKKEPVCLNEYGSLTGESAPFVKESCLWDLRVKVGNQIQVDFEEFSFHTNCSEDYVEIRNGLTKYAPVVARFCSGNLPYQIMSTSRFMMVRYEMSGKNQTKFKLNYKEIGSGKNDVHIAFNTDGCGNSALTRESDDGERQNNKLGDWPWQVALMKKGMSLVTCGGVLISPQWVMTAAHCFTRSISSSQWIAKLGSVDIQAGGKSEQTFDISVVRVHPNYNSSSNQNDIALVRLQKPAKLNNYVNTICLPDQGSDKLFETGNNCHVAGWGTYQASSDSVYPLSSLTLPIVSNTECDTFDDFAVTDNMLCAGSKNRIDTCHGDGGGSLMCKDSGGFVAIGINSVGEGCGNSENYGVYTDVRPYLDWIKVQIFM
ncbi:cubilin-like isoform X2 [Dendronephthya gigantea]|uniref:cubilin-like isoform X2 n=1 Tax=Dendronephthya gigantea TaxID=151771 RepID=UPI00106D6557|nr:cubilin-like isoform X2 [Dendronephthya gigantea]